MTPTSSNDWPGSALGERPVPAAHEGKRAQQPAGAAPFCVELVLAEAAIVTYVPAGVIAAGLTFAVAPVPLSLRVGGLLMAAVAAGATFVPYRAARSYLRRQRPADARPASTSTAATELHKAHSQIDM